jgi:hypothetical protein
MALTQPEKAFEFARRNSILSVQRALRAKYRKDCCLCDGKWSGRPTYQKRRWNKWGRLSRTVLRSPREVQAGSSASHTSFVNVSKWSRRKCSSSKQLPTFCVEMHQRIEEESFSSRLMFGDEATFRNTWPATTFAYGDVNTPMLQWNILETFQNSCSAPCLSGSWMTPFSSSRQQLLEGHFWSCYNCGSCHNWWLAAGISSYSYTVPHHIFTTMSLRTWTRNCFIAGLVVSRHIFRL